MSISESVVQQKEMSQEVLPWHKEPWARQMDAYQLSRIPHAQLITGEPGLGKRSFAYTWAKRLLCQATSSEESVAMESCGQCKSCSLFAADHHVDFRMVSSEEKGTQIKVDQVRSINEFVYARPQIAPSRVVMIEPADKLNVSASNALLKCLEEPSNNCYIILVSSHPSYLPATVRSRCQKVVIEKPPEAMAISWLSELNGSDDHATEAERIQRALGVARGAPVLAKELLQDKLLEEFELMQSQFWDVVFSRYTSSILDLAQQWSQQSIERPIQQMILGCYQMMRVITETRSLLQNTPDLQLSQLTKCHVATILKAIDSPENKKSLLQLLGKVENQFSARLDVCSQQQMFLRHHLLLWCYEIGQRLDRLYQDLLEYNSQLNRGLQVNKQLLMESILLRWHTIFEINPSS